MNLIHISDLHIGKRVNGFSMLEEQKAVLLQIIHYVHIYKPDAVMIAGDVYDKAVPTAEAVGVLDNFLEELSAALVSVFIISGNHDSPERLQFASGILEKQNIYIAGTYEGHLKHITLSAAEDVTIWMLPFIKPVQVKRYFPGETAESYEEAVKLALRSTSEEISEKSPKGINILMAHQFVTGRGQAAVRSDSEEILIGGLENIDESVFDAFDYVALGHLHNPQKVGRETIRYAGSVLKYSFSECRQNKSAVLMNWSENDGFSYELLPLKPVHDMRIIRGPIEQLLNPEIYSGTDTEDYICAVLTDELELPDAFWRLRSVYPNLMRLEIENRRVLEEESDESATQPADPMEWFEEFYKRQNGYPINSEQMQLAKKVWEQTGGDEV